MCRVKVANCGSPGPSGAPAKRLVSRRTRSAARFLAPGTSGDNPPLESLSYRELEGLGLVTPGGDAVAALGVQRNPVAEAEKTQRRQPGDRYPGAVLQLTEGEVVVLRRDVIGTVEQRVAAGLIDTTDVEEGADAGGLRPLARHREDQLVLIDDAQVATVGVAELIPRSEATLLEAAHRVRTAAEVFAIRRDGGGVAKRGAVVDAGAHREVELAPQREIPQEAVVGGPVLYVAAGRRHRQGDGLAHAAVGEQCTVARVPVPAADRLQGVEFGAVEHKFVVAGIVVAEPHVGIAVLLHPLLGLLGAAERVGEER